MCALMDHFSDLPVVSGFPTKQASKADSISISWEQLSAASKQSIASVMETAQ